MGGYLLDQTKLEQIALFVNCVTSFIRFRTFEGNRFRANATDRKLKGMSGIHFALLRNIFARWIPKALFAAKTMQLRNLPLRTTMEMNCQNVAIAGVTYTHRAAVSERKR